MINFSKNIGIIIIAGMLTGWIPVGIGAAQLCDPGFTASLVTVSDDAIVVRMETHENSELFTGNTFLVAVPPHGDIRMDELGLSENASASLEDLFWFRGNRIASIRVVPEKIEIQDKVMRNPLNFIVKIRFEPWMAEKPVPESHAMHGVIKDLVINPEDLIRWRIRGVMAENLNRKHTSFPGNQAVKLCISSDGICRITDEIDLSEVDPRTIQVFSQGNEVPVYVYGEADGVFDPEDYLEFLCSRYRNTDGSDNCYTDTNVYWVSWGDTQGARITLLDGSIPGSGLAMDYTETLILEENNLFGYGEYFWDTIRYQEVKSFDFDVDYKTCTLDPYVLRLRLKGMTSVRSVDPDHHIIIYWNEEPLHDGYWDSTDEYLLELPLPADWVNDGLNQLHLYLPGDTEAGEIEGCFVDWFELAYSRQYVARDDHLDFSEPLTGFLDRTDFEVSNFESPDLTLYRTDTNQKIINYQVTSSGGKYTVAFSDETGAAAYTAAAATGRVVPDRIEFRTPVDLKSTENEADYLIVCHPDFLTDLDMLTDHLKAKGLRVFTASIEDIFDTFSYGIWDPEALRAFCAYAYYNWAGNPPSYLLLVGDSSWDYKQYLPDSRPVNFLPAYGKTWTDSSYDPYDRGPFDAGDLIYGEPMVDDQFVCISGDDNIPDLAIGRLAVQTSEQLNNQILKIIRYENQTRDLSWQKNILFINGGVGDEEQDLFRGMSETMINSLVHPSGNYWHVSRIYKESDHREWGWHEEDITQAFNSGRLLVNFLGHGGSWSWEAMFNFDDINSLENADRLPVITSMTCNTVRFANPAIDCFGEQFTTGTGNLNGAAAFWGGCNFGGYWSDYYLAYYFFQYLVAERNRVLGDCILQVKIKTLIQYPGYAIIIEPYTLLGDPAMTVNLPSAPVISLAGFMNTWISTEFGGNLCVSAFITDPDGPDHIEQVELLYAGQPTGLFLEDDGNHNDFGAGDSVYGLSIPIQPNLLEPSVHPLGIRATDIEGNRSKPFPAFVSQ